MLEAQFGTDITPIERPRLPPTNTLTNGATTSTSATSAPTESQREQPPPPPPEAQQPSSAEPLLSETTPEDKQQKLTEAELAELARLQALGIPFPGVEIRVDRHVARVWLEHLDVECANGVLRDRVRVVVDRAVETVAGLWAEGPKNAGAAVNGSKAAAAEGEDEGEKS